MTHKGSCVVKPQHNHGIYPQLSIMRHNILTAVISVMKFGVRKHGRYDQRML